MKLHNSTFCSFYPCFFVHNRVVYRFNSYRSSLIKTLGGDASRLCCMSQARSDASLISFLQVIIDFDLDSCMFCFRASSRDVLIF